MCCIHKLRKIYTKILAEKTQEINATALDNESKKDIVRLLLNSRKAEAQQQDSSNLKTTSYQISDKDILDQIVCDVFYQELLLKKMMHWQSSFLLVGHETTALGLCWVGDQCKSIIY
jgi:hypothetical protein